MGVPASCRALGMLRESFCRRWALLVVGEGRTHMLQIFTERPYNFLALYLPSSYGCEDSQWFSSFLQGDGQMGPDNILASLSYRDVVITKNIKLHLFVFRILTSFEVWSGRSPHPHGVCSRSKPWQWLNSNQSAGLEPCPSCPSWGPPARLAPTIQRRAFPRQKAGFQSQRLEDWVEAPDRHWREARPSLWGQLRSIVLRTVPDGT